MPSSNLSRQDILDMVENRDGLPIEEIAFHYGIRVKTVLRYLTGESGSAITGIERPPTPEPLPPPVPHKVASLLKHGIDTPTLRAYYGFSLTGRLSWGICDSWDGMCYMASDGLIAWRDKGLCEFVARRGGCELPSKGVERVMCLGVGDVTVTPVDLAPNYLRIIECHRLQVHEAVQGTGVLYLTRINKKNNDDPSSAYVVISR